MCGAKEILLKKMCGTKEILLKKKCAGQRKSYGKMCGAKEVLLKNVRVKGKSY